MKLRELKRTILLVTLIENKLKEENEIIDKVGSHLKACVNNKEYVAEKKVSCQKHYRFLDINVGDQKNLPDVYGCHTPGGGDFYNRPT